MGIEKGPQNYGEAGAPEEENVSIDAEASNKELEDKERQTSQEVNPELQKESIEKQNEEKIKEFLLLVSQHRPGKRNRAESQDFLEKNDRFIEELGAEEYKRIVSKVSIEIEKAQILDYASRYHLESFISETIRDLNSTEYMKNYKPDYGDRY